MNISGKKSISGVLKIMLQICFIGGIAFLILLPIILMIIGKHMNAVAYILYPNGICFLIFVKQFIELFDLLKENTPFCDHTVKRLSTAGKAAGVMAILLMLQTLFEGIAVKAEIIFIFILGFMCVLFLGVSIALYILSELFKQAKEYKEENDLTV